MQTGGQVTDNEFRLDTETNAEAVRYIAFLEKSFAEMGYRRIGIRIRIIAVYASVIAIVESIHACT